MSPECGNVRMLSTPARRSVWRGMTVALVLILAGPLLSGCAGSETNGETQVFGGCYSYVFCRGGTGPPAEGECCVDEGGDR